MFIILRHWENMELFASLYYKLFICMNIYYLFSYKFYLYLYSIGTYLISVNQCHVRIFIEIELLRYVISLTKYYD